ncbi:MAG TPA: Fe-S cluster assembly protein HesB [Marmoricola sp.]|nr:Fe-S cluster assembly protein HesB [Marmoricola sp.]
MLTLTENASTIVNEITSQIGLGETGGLRITTDGSPQPNLELTAADQAQPGDQVVEQAGATVYLDASAAMLLDDKILDASVDEAGQPAFAIAPQA